MSQDAFDDAVVAVAVARGLAYLERRQRPDGSFAMYGSPDPTFVRSCHDEPTVFGVAMIAQSVPRAHCKRSRRIVARANAFLASTMVAGGLWRHFAPGHPWHRHTPSDADDTALVSMTLRQAALPVPENRRVLLANRDAAGRFYTWLLPRGLAGWWHDPRLAWTTLRNVLAYRIFFRIFPARADDVDGVVNANVTYYLGDIPETRGAIRFLLETIEGRREAQSDRWYQSAVMFAYATARALASGIAGLEPARSVLHTRSLEFAEASTSVLETALALSAAAFCGPLPDVGMPLRRLVAAQNADGSWAAEPAYYGAPGRNEPIGSEEVTTALCIEALVRSNARSGGKILRA